MPRYTLHDPNDFRPLATVTYLTPDRIYEKYGHVVIYEAAGERKLIGYVDIGVDAEPFLYREEEA